jgi:hypothetical protein
MKLLAIPLFELYDNAARYLLAHLHENEPSSFNLGRYGPQLSAIPHLLSRLVSCPI